MPTLIQNAEPEPGRTHPSRGERPRASMLRSILTNWVAMAVAGVISFAITPILVHRLGHLYYGMWILISSVLDYYGVLDMGLRTAIQRFVARYRGADERTGLDKTLSTGLVLSSGLCLLICGLTVPVARSLPGIFGIHEQESHLFSQLVVLLGLSAAFTFPARVLGAYLCGLQRYDLYNLNAIVGAVIRAALLVAALKMGYGVWGCAVVALATTVLSLVMSAWLVMWADPDASLSWKHATIKQSRELVSFSFYMLLATTGDLLRTRLDSFVIARWLGIALVTPYNVAARLIDHFRVVMFSLLGPLLTEMSALDAKSSRAELQRLFLRFSKVTALLSLCITVLLFVDGKALLRYWVGSDFVSSFSVLMVLALGRCIAVGQTPSIVLLIACGRNRFVGWMTLIEGLANLALSVYWAHTYGLIGVALGTLVPLLISKGLIQPWYTLSVAGVSTKQYLQKALAPPFVVCALFLGICATCRLITSADTGLLSFLAKLTAQILLFSLLTWIIGLSTEDRRSIGRQKLNVSWLRRTVVLTRQAS